MSAGGSGIGKSSRTVLATDLPLRDDDLGRELVAWRDGVAEDANSTDDTQRLLHLVGEVAGVSDDHLAGRVLVSAADGGSLPLRVVDDLVDGRVEHVSATIHRTEAREGLGQLAEAVAGIDVRRLAVANAR